LTPASDESWDLVKSAAVAELVEKGVEVSDAEKALDELAKKAGYGETRSIANSFPFDAEEVVGLIEKSAKYIGELEAKIESDKDTISGLEARIEKAASIDSDDLKEALIEKGFSEEDASSLIDLPSETLNKVASMANGEPWEMGKGARAAEDGMDPFTKFLFS
jgi:hypothetical protein